MKLTPTKTPFVVKKMFPDYVWEINTAKKELFLTFDDGPTPEVTPWVLDQLKRFNAKATFFCIGANIEKHPEIFKRIMEEGHSIGNHTQNHIKGWKTKTKAYLENVLEAQKTIADQTSNHINHFRPPYGQIKPKQGKKLMALGYKIVMWDVLSFDWDKGISNEDCLNQVISKSKAGSIVVFHDSVKASNNMTYALPKVLEYYSKQGFLFKAIES
ncbi:peptidoglycan/xylan/chitin deacetylase (PgdA/CDA1 family) [Flavobacteriaceae bacterium MAR_2010_72]|nr:peptidoglycan/xylan/chitin deacetylase (PgdA/CDA1 family) [Flavobacteriaceae bacterium MAR_2010_72]TVZ58565.1 peptidoglycan/xylan/chitin deacetylase (PgdA/CDA1 family) [Flavobacteriaceae bacterium MAR_2010_105]